MKKILGLLFVCFTLGISVSFADEPQDHPLIKPLQGSSIQCQQISNIDEYTLAMSKIEDDEFAKTKELTGKISMTTYMGEETNSTFEIYNHMKELFTQEGFEIVFECSKQDCDQTFSRKLYALNPYRENYGYKNSIILTEGKSERKYYLVGQKKSAAGEIFVNCFITAGWDKNPYYRVDVIEPASSSPSKSSEDGKSASAQMAEQGKIVLQSVKFLQGKSELVGDSVAALKPAAENIAAQPELNFMIVAHCAELESHDANLKLSEQRAAEVVRILSENLKIDGSRLLAVGVGDASPIASNHGDNRKTNTRIELVEALGKFKAAKEPFALGSHPITLGSRPTLGTHQNIPEFQIKLDASLAAQAQKEGQSFSLPGSDLPPAVVATPEPEVIKKPEKPLVKVPSVVGKLRLAGKNTLEKMGFKVKFVGKKVGKITKQSPASNSNIEQGSVITLTIGK